MWLWVRARLRLCGGPCARHKTGLWEIPMAADFAQLPLLPDDVYVIDPVVHALNLDHANVASRYGEQLYAMSHGLHAMLSPRDRTVPQNIYMTDMRPETLARTMLEESQTALMATHTLTLDSWFHDGFAAEWKTVAMARDFPTRVLSYVGVDPTGDKGFVLEELARQVEQTPNAIGVKLYPHQMNPYRRWLTNDDTVMALIDRAQTLGLRSIAIHKALPNGSVPLSPYRIGEDFEEAADSFPQMTFEIIHAGMAFIEETAMAIGRFPNVYANLETTTAMLWQAPGRFAAALALLMQWGGPEKTLWSTGCTVVHPQHLLQLFWAFAFDEETMARHGIPQLDDGIKRMILGGNYARAAGIDIGDWQARQAEDGWRIAPLRTPWSVWTGNAG
ncbi:amidohydrolase [Sphingobium algorifonticola]|uniref:Amidohydrolase n=2 Tax=Sphingobium algorifonticola TaxID=2008318 RepID=A0A437J9X0_9SPHN|nr:amidohydrolase [Sphingobium algorifonticola]